MLRILAYALLTLTILLLMAVGVAAYLVSDEDFLKSQITQQVRELTGRELQLNGPLELDLGKTTQLSARDIEFANADWAGPQPMAQMGELLIALHLPDLLDGVVNLPLISVKNCNVELLETAENGANWDLAMGDSTGEESDTVDFREILIDECRIIFISHEREIPIDAHIDTFSMNLGEDLFWQVAGRATINEESLSLDGRYGPYQVFVSGGRMEHDLVLDYNNISLRSSGSIEDALAGTGANIEASFAGPSIDNMLRQLGAPVFSEGPFDFRLKLASSADATDISISGDIGSIDIIGDGTVDKLFDVSKGQLKFDAEGPDLQALGEAFELTGLVAEPYRLRLDAEFAPKQIVLKSTSLTTANDSLTLTGDLLTSDQLAGSSLDFVLDSPEIGRWAPLVGQPQAELGSLQASGNLGINEQGLLSSTASLTSGENHLEIDGNIITLQGDLKPDLKIDFSSSDISPLAYMAGISDFPAIPVKLSGNLGHENAMYVLDEMKLDFGTDSARINGHVNPVDRLSGSEFEVALDIKNLAVIGQWFGYPDLPADPLRIAAMMRPEGKGLYLKLDELNDGELTLTTEVRIPDLQHPATLDASFDIYLPDLRIISFLAGDMELPAIPAAASGALTHTNNRTELEDVNLRLGKTEANLSGYIAKDLSYDLALAANSPDLSIFTIIADTALPAESWTVDSKIKGNSEQVSLTDLEMSLGESDVTSSLDIQFKDIPVIRGVARSQQFDIAFWIPDKNEPAEAPAKKERVFDDTPISKLQGINVDLVLDVKISKLISKQNTFNDVEGTFTLAPGFLQVNPFSIRPPQGSLLTGDFELDQRITTPTLNMRFSGEGMRFGLFRVEGQEINTVPASTLQFDLSGRGQTYHEMASTLNGELLLETGEGLIADAGMNALFSDFLTELFTMLNPFAKTSEYTTMDCTVVAANISDGEVSIRPAVIQTTELTILSEGVIDLESEKINLSFSTKPRTGIGLSAGMIINPLIKVGGSMSAPAIEIDPKGTVITGGAAVATAGLSLLAKSFSDRFLSSKDPCGDALAEIEEKDANP